MAKIPDATALGERTIADGRREYTPDRSAAILADGSNALIGVGESLRRMAQHDDQYRYSLAKVALESRASAFQKQFETDPDFDTFESRYQEGMKQAGEEAAKMIRGGRSRALFESEARLDVDRGAVAVRALARQQEGQWGRSSLDELLETSRRAALETKDQGARAAIEQSTTDAITGALQNRYITPEVAQNMRQSWSQAYGEGFLAMQTPVAQVALLAKPDGTPAARIDPAKRAVLLKHAQVAATDEKVNSVVARVASAYERNTAAGERELASIKESDLSPTEQLEARGKVISARGIIHAERRQQFNDRVTALERSIAQDNPANTAENEAAALYSRGAYTPEQYTSVLEGMDRARAERAKKGAAGATVAAAILNGERLNPRNDKIVDAVDSWFVNSSKDAGIQPGSDEWLNNASAIAAKTNVLPPEAMNWARKNLLSGEPEAAVAAANAITRFSDAAPFAYKFFDDSVIKAQAEAIDGMVRAGVKPAQAVENARKLLIDIPKARLDTLQVKYNKELKSASNESDLQSKLNADDAFETTFFGKAPAPSLRMQDEYGAQVRRYFDLTDGDITRARALAWKDLRGTYGISTVNGAPEVLKYAPELVFPGINPAVIRNDIDTAANERGITTPVSLTPSRATGDTHGVLWNLSTTDEDGNTELLLDEKNRPLVYAIPTDTATYVQAQESAKRAAIEAARAESAKRRAVAESMAELGSWPGM